MPIPRSAEAFAVRRERERSAKAFAREAYNAGVKRFAPARPRDTLIANARIIALAAAAAIGDLATINVR